jgi:anti-sigma regulatory factor (Ser/Thr protein kinase)
LQKKKSKAPMSAKEYLLANIENHPRDLVSIACRYLKISPVAVQKHLRQLMADGKVYKEGNTRGTRWILAPEWTWKQTFILHKGMDEDQIFQSMVEPRFKQVLAANVFNIIKFGFTEIVNNAIDHAQAHQLSVELSVKNGIVRLTLRDDGIGIFEKIQKAFHLANFRESILELTKGKVTTDPTRHTGEGIFFTSRAFDLFSLQSNGVIFRKDNLQDDWFIESQKDEKKRAGTEVILEIRERAPTELREIFEKYTDPDSLAFKRTEIVVELAKDHPTDYISRSQAKRILAGLEKFENVILDFRNVSTVGQGFVDEVFRVFANANPAVQFDVTNANKDVLFMIRRGIATARS